MTTQIALLETKTDILTYEQFCETLSNLILYADLLETGMTEKRDYYTAVIKHQAHQLSQLLEPCGHRKTAVG
jgi:hypothetical protein